MLSLRFVAILAFSAAVSGTNDPVDCEVTTDFQDPSLRAGALSATIPMDNKLPNPYRGLEYSPEFGVYQSTAIEEILNPNRFIFLTNGDSLTVTPRIRVDAVSFSQLKLEQYSTVCIARTGAALVNYLIDCTIEVLDNQDLTKPAIDTFKYKREQRVELSALKDDDFDTHKISKPQFLPALAIKVTYLPDSIAQLLGGNPITGYGVLFDNFKYGLQKAPGGRAPCPMKL
ncbi:hypothetical protein PG999_004687 [Apiospora kogelbergensis]|uniref:Uncharacterized protein n=1 Tax=Apiospora kogelbergensis TaxID=1337665 RepID=A0AAW0QZY8_9PEZI